MRVKDLPLSKNYVDKRQPFSTLRKNTQYIKDDLKSGRRDKFKEDQVSNYNAKSDFNDGKVNLEAHPTVATALTKMGIKRNKK